MDNEAFKRENRTKIFAGVIITLILLTSNAAVAFSVGDAVQTTDYLNVRTGPGTNYAIIKTMPPCSVGEVIAGPRFGSGYTWYKIEYFMGPTGWSAANWLEPADSCVD